MYANRTSAGGLATLDHASSIPQALSTLPSGRSAPHGKPLTGAAAAAAGQEFSVFVGDLSPDLKEEDLGRARPAPFLSTKSAKIMTDSTTGASRGFGFVRFTQEADCLRALVEMQGVVITPSSGLSPGRPLRVCTATPKNRVTVGGDPVPGNPATLGLTPADTTAPAANPAAALTHDGHASSTSSQSTGPINGAPSSSATDPSNTTVFVGGLSSLISEDTLKTFFVPFGDITYVKIPPGKGCGFVQFVRKADAERAIERMQGFPIGGGRIRLSWGRSQGDKAAA
ncbi:RNA-binding domain-containing protein, partial [Violaceomyces palustris]